MRLAGATAVLTLALMAGACREAPEPPPERRLAAGPQIERGYRPTSERAPRVVWQGQEWMPADSEYEGLDQLFGHSVVLVGRMALDESSPSRASFRLVHDYDGCVAPGHHRSHGDPIHVSMVDGRPIQVTDKPLAVEGVLRFRRLADGSPRLELQGAAAEPLAMSARRRRR